MDLAESSVSSWGSRVAGPCPGGLDAAQREKLKGDEIYQMSRHVLEVILFDIEPWHFMARYGLTPLLWPPILCIIQRRIVVLDHF